MKRISEEIRTERLILHRHRLEEVADQFKAISKERERLAPFIPWVSKVEHQADLLRRAEVTLTDWENRTLFDFTLKTMAGKFIGHAGLYRCDWSVPKVEIGYWLLAAAEGKGYVQEAVSALEQECKALGVERIEIRCDPINVRSSQVARRLGYHLEGTLRKNIRINGRLLDTEVWTKTAFEGPASTARPPFIGHWKDFYIAENWAYPGSTEWMGRGSPVGRKLGLEKIGIHIEMLEPGRRTSWPHAESEEEEFAYVIEGTPDVWIDGVLYPLRPGDFVAFPAGTGISHTFINNSVLTCQLLIGGEAKKATNQIFYPLHPQRNEDLRALGQLWENVPARPLGPHNGLPNRPKSV